MTESLRIELSGTDHASAEGITHKGRKSPICELARLLIEAGHSPDTQAQVYRDGMLVFDSTALSWWAARTVTETDRQSVKHVMWSPMPESLYK